MENPRLVSFNPDIVIGKHFGHFLVSSLIAFKFCLNTGDAKFEVNNVLECY